MTTIPELQQRAHLATLALISFILSFVVARTFTTFYPSTVLVGGGIHIHHFWFGLVLLAIGGWLGISYRDTVTDRLAAIIYGAGGGLIVDEVGLLLTFGNYWTSLTYTIMIVLLAFVTIMLLLYRYRQTIVSEFAEFLSSNASLYLGVFLGAISIAFITETKYFLITAISSGLTVLAVIIVLVYIVEQINKPK